MPSAIRRYCSCCGRSAAEVGPISTRGYCVGCSQAIQLANVQQLRAKAGPFAEHWQRRTAEGVARAIARSGDSAADAA